jgi:broad specificity phosphatase PhoE
MLLFVSHGGWHAGSQRRERALLGYNGCYVAADEAELVLVRHGETEWSKTGRHTGATDIPLTARGREQAEAIGRALGGMSFDHMVSSPLARAAQTCRLAGLAEGAERWPELREWDYGAYDGLTTAEIRATRPGWTLWRDGVPDGETIAQVGVRADHVIADLRALGGAVAVFSHGHFLRVLAARWLGLAPADGRLFALDAGTISTLGHEYETSVIRLWNTAPAMPG